MHQLSVLFTALTVFGVGVTIVDLFGVFDHGSGSTHDDDPGSGADHDGDTADAVLDQEGAAEGDDGPGHGAESHEAHGGRGSNLASADGGTRAVAKAVSILRLSVYFSLGAGPTGLFGLLTGQGIPATLAWSAGAGAFTAFISRALRKFIRKDIDSSIKPEEYLLDEAVLTVAIAPGAIGKAAVRRYGTENAIYVKCGDAAAALAKGEKVRIVDFDDEYYYVERIE